MGNIQTFPANSGGTDWGKQTPKLKGYDSTSDTTYTVLSVTGSGYLHGIHHGSGAAIFISIFIDGVFIGERLRFDGDFASSLDLGQMRFNSSLVIYCNVNTEIIYLNAAYSLD